MGNRKQPFGYRMELGVIVRHPQEAPLVEQIFRQYLSGATYNALVAELRSQPVPYDEGKVWNKNMLARILEDKRYTGKGGYPAIIPAAALAKASEKRSAKQRPSQQTEAQKVLRRLCGHRVTEQTERQVLNLLNRLAGRPERIAIRAIITALKEMLETVDRDKVLGIGISSPGPLDCEKGRIINPPRFERWHGVEISRLLSEALELPAYLEHDVCALALHQLEMGQSQNFMLVFVDIGIGAAIMSGGKLLGNSKNFTGELGHTTIRFDGRLCECGNRGCLETYASIPILLEGTEFSSWRDLIDHVDNNPAAQKLLDQEAVYLSAGLINLLNLIPVDTIYLAGDICYRYEELAQRLQREIGAKALDRSKSSIKIYPSSQHPNVGVLAAADVVFSQFFTV